MKKAYFQYYETFENVLEKIKDIEEREHMRKTIINYGLYGTLPAGLSELEAMAWVICKELIDQQQHRRQTNADNARSPKAAPVRLDKPTDKPKAPRFVKPTLEELTAYIKEKGYNINAETFFNYYEGNGWKVGRNSMKNWKATVQNWAAREKANGGTIYQNAEAPAEDYSDLF